MMITNQPKCAKQTSFLIKRKFSNATKKFSLQVKDFFSNDKDFSNNDEISDKTFYLSEKIWENIDHNELQGDSESFTSHQA